MRKYFVLAFFCLNVASAFAQFVPRHILEDSVLGWIKVYNFKGSKESKKVDDKIYSAAQLSICDSFANWIQASYVPKGGLGDITRNVSEKISPYNQYAISLPQSYGAYASTYYFLVYNKSRKLVPENNLSVKWGIAANDVPGWPIRDLSTSSQYFFTMPSFESYHDGGESAKKLHDLSNVPALKPYTTFWVKSVESGGGTDYVLLSKNNRSPFLKLTKGEYLKELEAAIPRYYQDEKKKIHENNRGNQRSIDYFMKYLEEKNVRLIDGLQK